MIKWFFTLNIKCMASHFAADIGNSRIKLRSGNEYLAVNTSNESIYIIEDFFKKFEQPINIFFSSVNKEFYQYLSEYFKNSEINFINAIEFPELKQRIDFSQITGIGSDRILGLLGASLKFKPPLITVDCGTAVTVNVLNKDYFCLGGAIFPGLETQVKSLAENTSLLKFVDIKQNNQIIGKNTDDAIRCGVICSVTGGIKEIIQGIINEVFKNANVSVIFTGGGSELIYQSFLNVGYPVFLNKYLILEAIEFLMDDFVNNK